MMEIKYDMIISSFLLVHMDRMVISSFPIGQASSQNAKAAGLLAEEMAKLGWSFVESPTPSGAGFSRGGSIPQQRKYSTWTASRRQYSTHAKPGIVNLWDLGAKSFHF